MVAVFGNDHLGIDLSSRMKIRPSFTTKFKMRNLQHIACARNPFVLIVKHLF